MDYSVTKHPEIKDDKDVLNFTNNEIKKMVISELYLPSRNAQKAMNELETIYKRIQKCFVDEEE